LPLADGLLRDVLDLLGELRAFLDAPRVRVCVFWEPRERFAEPPVLA
jgi:hypothetical protein